MNQELARAFVVSFSVKYCCIINAAIVLCKNHLHPKTKKEKKCCKKFRANNSFLDKYNLCIKRERTVAITD